MLITVIISLAVAVIFFHTMFFGAPFLPTRRSRIVEALDLLDLKPGQLMLELGSGDGRLLREAAKRGVRSIGYELNPLLVLYSRLLSWRYRGLIQIKQANYWNIVLPPCDAVYVFLLNPYMAKLDTKINTEICQPVKVLSFAFPMPDKQPVKDSNGLLLYDYQPVASSPTI